MKDEKLDDLDDGQSIFAAARRRRDHSISKITPFADISFGIDLSQDVMLTAYYHNATAALPYQKFSTLYLATNANPILSFHGINATNGLAVTNGILLDNVSMTLAYPPLTLNFSRPSSLVFHWPYTNSSYRLQADASLLTTNWVTLSNAPANFGTNSQITLPAPATTQFYRLTLP